MNKQQLPSASLPNLIEMLVTFLVLAETLNVTHTVQIIGSTRQTVKRQIKALETLRGHALFTVLDKNYSLTDEGISAISSASKLVFDAANWAKSQPNIAPIMSTYNRYTDQDNYIYLGKDIISNVNLLIF